MSICLRNMQFLQMDLKYKYAPPLGSMCKELIAECRIDKRIFVDVLKDTELLATNVEKECNSLF